MACANVDGNFYAVDGRCPRCSFDLYRGTLLVDAEVSFFRGGCFRTRRGLEESSSSSLFLRALFITRSGVQVRHRYLLFSNCVSFISIDRTCVFRIKMTLFPWKEPRVACPTCSVTYSLKTGKHGPELKRAGIAGFVSTWTKTATRSQASQDVSAFIITRNEETGSVYCRER